MAAERYRPNMLLWILVCFSGCFFICGESTPVTTQSTVTYDSPLQVSDVMYSDQMISQSANTDSSTESVSIGNADYGTSSSAIRPADVSTVSAAMPTSTSENSFPPDSTAPPGFKWTATTIAFGTGCLILIIVVAIGTFFVCRMKRRLRRYKVINYTTNQRPMTYDDPYNINDDINTMVGDEHSNGNTVVLTTMRKIETSPPPTLGPAPKPPVPVARRPAPPTPSSPSTPKETMETKTLFDKVADATIKGHSKETSKTTSSEEPGKDKTTAKKATAGAQISGAAVSERQDNKKPPHPQAIQKLQKNPSGDSEDGLYETFDNSIKHLRRDMSYMSDMGQDALANGTYEEPLSRGLNASGLPSVDVNPDDMYEPIDGDMVSKIRRQSEELNFQRQMSGLPDTPEVNETEDGSSMTEYAAGISIADGRVDSSGQKTGMPDQAMSPLGLHSIPLNNTIDERDENYDGDDDDDDEEQHVYDDFDLDEVVHAEPVNVHETNAQIQMTENATQADQVLTEENVNRDEEDQELYDDGEIRMVEEKSVLAMKQDPKKRLQKLLAVDYSNEEDEDEEEELDPRETFTSESMLSVNYSRSNKIEVDVEEEKGEDEEPDLYENVTLKDTMVIDYSKLNEEEEAEVEDDDVGSIISQRSSLTDSLQQPESSFPPLPSTPAPSFTFTSPPSLQDVSPPISSPPSPPIHSHPSTQNVSHMPPFSQNTPTDLKDTPLDIQVTPSDLPDTPPPRLPLLPPPMLISHGSADSSPTTVPPEPQFPPPPPPPNLLAGSPDMLNFSLNEKPLLPSGETHSTESLPKRASMQSLLTPNAYDDSNLPAVPSRRDVPIKARSSSGNPTLSLDDINQPLPLMKGLASSLEAMESATYFVDKEDLQQEMFEQNHPLFVPRQSVTRMPTVARDVPLNDSESLLPQTNNYNQADASKAKVNQHTNVIHQKRMPGPDDVKNSDGGMPTSQRPLADTHQQKARSSSSISEWVAFDDDSGAAGSHGNDSDDNVYENITLEQNK